MEDVELTHVAVVAKDLQQSIDWYVDLFGSDAIRRMPNPKLIGPTVWLKLGTISIHITEWHEATNLRRNHFGIGVMDLDRFQAIYRKAKERDLFERDTFGSHIYELPGGEVQMYLLDPGGNLVEVDFPDAAAIDRRLIDDMPKLSDLFQPQPTDAHESTLFPWLRGRGELARN